MRVLVVEDDATSIILMEKIIQMGGFDVLMASDGVQAFKIYEELQPEIVITDIEMPGMNGLDLLAEIRKRSADTVVMIISGHGSEDYALRALRARANDYLRKPIDAAYLLTMVRHHAQAIESLQVDREIPNLIRHCEMTMTFASDPRLVHGITNYLINQTGGLMAKDEQPMIRMGLVEMILNAIEHGNLAITNEEKAQALQTVDGFKKLLAERQVIPELARRQVTLETRLCPQFGEWTITDEGDGFDWQAVGDEISPEALFARNGRGIIITRIQFDEMEYIGCGNKVRLRKNFTPSPSSCS